MIVNSAKMAHSIGNVEVGFQLQWKLVISCVVWCFSDNFLSVDVKWPTASGCAELHNLSWNGLYVNVSEFDDMTRLFWYKLDWFKLNMVQTEVFIIFGIKWSAVIVTLWIGIVQVKGAESN